MIFKKVLVTYHANYNGVTLTDEQGNDLLDGVVDHLAVVAEEEICDALVGECDDDGMYVGADEEVVRVCTNTVQEHFGDYIEVVVSVDYRSS